MQKMNSVFWVFLGFTALLSIFFWTQVQTLESQMQRHLETQDAQLKQFKATLIEELRAELSEIVVNGLSEQNKDQQRAELKPVPCVCECGGRGRGADSTALVSAPKFVPPFKKREQLGDLAEREGMKVGLEIGVQEGKFAESMLSKWKSVQTYYCLDAWEHQENYMDVANKEQKVQDSYYEATQKRLKKFEPKVQFVRAFSNVAVSQFEDESIDLIYVDARHDYTGVTEDITLYWPKLRPGGIIAGHDYVDVAEVAEPQRQRWGKQDWSINPDGTKRTDGKAVRSAANEFAASKGRQIMVTYEDGYWPTWVLRK
eukprot:TRINITY_DN9401_c0_g1_i2.p1 TRINITY_DN9401_c0_g1~~TRINITY_DN9401_c0_g1_i2.p1  ORF type:complete len:314 (+),score=29.95 TRINITY_DN9401_c0_g1_i2:56-997(+)